MDITREELFRIVWSEPLSSAAERFGMSGNGLGKLCDRLHIPRPPRNHWTRAEKDRAAPPKLDPPPAGIGQEVAVGDRAPTGRRRTRLDPEERREQLMDAAARIALDHGWAEVTMKSVAREAGISEAQVHNCFGGRNDLLISLARRELESFERQRRSVVARAGDHITRIALSTVHYLHEAAERGPLLQILLRNPDVREALKPDRRANRSATQQKIAGVLSEQSALTNEEARAATSALSAVSRRGGAMVGSGRRELSMVLQWCLAIVLAGAHGNRRVAAK